MIARALVVTLVLTCAGVLLILMEIGNGGLLYLAILGSSAVWLLPGPLSIALPAGAFGGVLFSRAGHETGDMTEDEGTTVATVRLTVLATVLSVLTVGWLVPLAYHGTGQAVSRFQDPPATIEQEIKPTEIMLDELLVHASSMPAARQELMRRAFWIMSSFLMPLFAGAIVAVIPRWTQHWAAAATLAVFGVSVHLAFRVMR